MKINKKIIKKSGIVLFSMALGLGALGGGYYLSQNQASAEGNQLEQVMVSSENIDQLATQVVSASVLDTIGSELDLMKSGKLEVTETKLDNMSYYLIYYMENSPTVISLDKSGITSYLSMFDVLLDLYKSQNFSPSVKWVDDSKQSVEVIKNLNKPEDFNTVVKSLNSESKDVVEDVLINSESKDVNIELESKSQLVDSLAE